MVGDDIDVCNDAWSRSFLRVRPAEAVIGVLPGLRRVEAPEVTLCCQLACRQSDDILGNAGIWVFSIAHWLYQVAINFRIGIGLELESHADDSSSTGLLEHMDLPHWCAYRQNDFLAGVRAFQVAVLFANNRLVRSIPHLEAREDSTVLAPVELRRASDSRQVIDDVSIIASLCLPEPSGRIWRHHIINTVKLK